MEVIGGGPYHYSWTRDGEVIDDNDDFKLVIKDTARSNSGTYSVTVGNNAGSVRSANINIDVYEAGLIIKSTPKHTMLT